MAVHYCSESDAKGSTITKSGDRDGGPPRGVLEDCDPAPVGADYLEVLVMPSNVWPNYIVEALLVLAFLASLVLRYPHHE